ncbi:MAG: CGNR zinc finger domain-containing protein [Candidatus Eremiobacteraeota bacterium]|nr:CGNR zinc finger domain-containing protein [Candidatus Eremiobacteraeota bacterium]
MLGSTCLEYAALDLGSAREFAEALVRFETLTYEPAPTPEELAEARTLRDAVSRCLKAVAGGAPLLRRDVETLNAFAADETPLVKLALDGTLVRVATDAVRCALSAVARDAIELLARRGDNLSACLGCGAIFLDASRGKRRRWCAMQRCGNRAKVAGYRSRQR